MNYRPLSAGETIQPTDEFKYKEDTPEYARKNHTTSPWMPASQFAGGDYVGKPAPDGAERYWRKPCDTQ